MCCCLLFLLRVCCYVFVVYIGLVWLYVVAVVVCVFHPVCCLSCVVLWCFGFVVVVVDCFLWSSGCRGGCLNVLVCYGLLLFVAVVSQ